LSDSPVDIADPYVISKDNSEPPSIENRKPDRSDADDIQVDFSPSNLAIKGIIAIRAMSSMSLAAGHIDDANKHKVFSSSSNTYSEIDPPIEHK